MSVIFHKTKHTWNSVEDIETLESPEEFVIDPVFDDFEAAQLVSPRFWVFYGENNVRIMTPEEMDADASLLTEAKVAKITELSVAAGNNITSGVISDAIGSSRRYDAELEDQANMLGSILATSPSVANPEGTSMYYASRDPSTGVKAYLPHTYTQLRQVLDDGAAFKLQVLVTFNGVKDAVLAMTSVADVNAVTWTDVEQS